MPLTVLDEGTRLIAWNADERYGLNTGRRLENKPIKNNGNFSPSKKTMEIIRHSPF